MKNSNYKEYTDRRSYRKLHIHPFTKNIKKDKYSSYRKVRVIESLNKRRGHFDNNLHNKSILLNKKRRKIEFYRFTTTKQIKFCENFLLSLLLDIN